RGLLRLIALLDDSFLLINIIFRSVGTMYPNLQQEDTKMQIYTSGWTKAKNYVGKPRIEGIHIIDFSRKE
ncbi:hypothetical protein ACJX0J_024988, partial [Zea mays]